MLGVISLSGATSCDKNRILHEWSFHIKFIKPDFGEFNEFNMEWSLVNQCKILLIMRPFKCGYIAFKVWLF